MACQSLAAGSLTILTSNAMPHKLDESEERHRKHTHISSVFSPGVRVAAGWGESFTSSDVERKAIGQIRFFCFLLELSISAAMWLATTLVYHRAGFGRLLVRDWGHGVYDDITEPLSSSARNCLSLCGCHLATSFSLSSHWRDNSNMYFTAFTYQNLWILVYLCSSQHNISQWSNTTQDNHVFVNVMHIFLSFYELDWYFNR